MAIPSHGNRMNKVFTAHLRQELLEDRLFGGYAEMLVSRCFDLFFLESAA